MGSVERERHCIHVGAPTLHLLSLHRGLFEVQTMKRCATPLEESPDACKFWPHSEKSSLARAADTGERHCFRLQKRVSRFFDRRLRNAPPTDAPQSIWTLNINTTCLCSWWFILQPSPLNLKEPMCDPLKRVQDWSPGAPTFLGLQLCHWHVISKLGRNSFIWCA